MTGARREPSKEACNRPSSFRYAIRGKKVSSGLSGLSEGRDESAFFD